MFLNKTRFKSLNMALDTSILNKSKSAIVLDALDIQVLKNNSNLPSVYISPYDIALNGKGFFLNSTAMALEEPFDRLAIIVPISYQNGLYRADIAGLNLGEWIPVKRVPFETYFSLEISGEPRVCSNRLHSALNNLRGHPIHYEFGKKGI